MPIKDEARALLNNKFFLLVKAELEKEYFDGWIDSSSNDEREVLHIKCRGIIDFMEIVEAQANEYENGDQKQ